MPVSKSQTRTTNGSTETSTRPPRNDSQSRLKQPSPPSPPPQPIALGFGSNFFYNLSTASTSTPTLLPTLPAPPTQITCGQTHTTILTSSKNVYSLGFLHGRLFTSPTKVEIQLPIKVMQIAHGRRHCLALMEGGVVVSWGAGHFGQLGHGGSVVCLDRPRVVERLLPQVVGGKTLSVHCGALHSAALISTNSTSQTPNLTLTWGANRKNQCGVENGPCNTVPFPTRVHNGPPFRTVALGKHHSLGLSVTGSIYSWGMNRDCQLISLSDDVIMEGLAVGDKHSLALDRNGRVWSWGSNVDGQCGLGGISSVVSFPKLVNDLAEVRVRSVYASGSYSVAVDERGYIFTWGYGDAGQLGHRIPEQGNGTDLYSLEALLAGGGRSGRIGGNGPRVRDARGFDSRLTVLLPRRVKCLENFSVESVSAGPAHMIVLGRERDGNDYPIIQRTRYEKEVGENNHMAPPIAEHKPKSSSNSSVNRKSNSSSDKDPPTIKITKSAIDRLPLNNVPFKESATPSLRSYQSLPVTTATTVERKHIRRKSWKSVLRRKSRSSKGTDAGKAVVSDALTTANHTSSPIRRSSTIMRMGVGMSKSLTSFLRKKDNI